MTIRTRVAALGLAGLLAAMPAMSGASAAGFTAEQRAEIIAIMRNALQKDPSILRDAIEALRADENQREQASSRAAIAQMRDKLIDANDHVAGNPKGDVTIVEFFDVRCGYCKRLEPTMAQLLAQDKNIRLVYKDLPVLGPASVLGARAVMAARKQNAYEKMREALMHGSPNITMASLEAQAKTLNLDWERLKRDMDDPAIKAQIDSNLALAHALGIQGTPAMVIGSELIPGAVGLEELKQAVDEVRSKKS